MRSITSELEELQEQETREQARAWGASQPAGPWQVSSVGFREPGEIGVFQYDEGDLPEGQFRLQTLFCGISAGTRASATWC